MKRVIKLSIIVLSIITLFACSHNTIEKELDNILINIPSKFDEDFTLPTSNDFDVSYSITNTEIIDNTVIYNVNDADIDCLLTVTLSSETTKLSRSIIITMLYNEEKWFESEKFVLSNLLNDYKALLPKAITEDFGLPVFNLGEGLSLDVNIITTLSKNSNGQYIYNFPTSDSSLTVHASISKENGPKVEEDIIIPILSPESKNSVPKIYLDVEGKITKEEYLEGLFTLQERDVNGMWVDTYTNLEMKIKGRGNSTWGFDKKPYKIKFSSKTSFFGEGKAKTWTLIANYIDHSLMRNYAAYFLGRSLDGLLHTTSANFVDVYLNGEYKGNYLLCEQVEVDKNRLNITDDEESIDTGFLLELDGKFFDSNTGDEGKEYFYCSMHGQDYLFAMHTPDPEDSALIREQVSFIKDYLQEAVLVLKGNTDRMYDYFDLDSAVDSFIVNEITKNKDVGWSSFYIYKDKGGKIGFGPIWDYDLSSLGQGNISREERSPRGWYTETSYKNPFYDYFVRNETFRKAVKARWEEIKDNQLVDLINELYRIKNYIYYSANENFKVWDVIGKETGWWISDEEHALSTWVEQVDLLINYYKERIEWITNELKTW